jgi:serine protease Do
MKAGEIMNNENKPIEELMAIDQEKGSTLIKDTPEEASLPIKGKDRRFRNLVIIVLIISLVGGCSIGAGIGLVDYILDDNSQSDAYFLDNTAIIDTQPLAYRNDQDITTIAERIGASVVSITSKITVNDWFSNSYETEGQGSGVIFNINEEGLLIVTNHHVVDGANELIVELSENVHVPASLIGYDPENDLAVIKVSKENLTDEQFESISPVVFGDSDALKSGEIAIAIGNPLGYSNTVTVGVISAVDRELQTLTGDRIFIQTDAAINPGNSGGALVNSKGEVIGINTIKIADTQVEGLGFAIPINIVKPIIVELIEKGYISRPYLGISGRDITEDLAALYEIPIGIYVMQIVPNSGADEAGLQRGDIIIDVDDKKVLNMETLLIVINSKEVGDKILLKIIRDSETKLELTATLKDKNAN